MLKLALIGDIHHGPDRGTKKGTAALSLLERYVDHVNGRPPDFVIELGDRISDIDRDTDLRESRTVSSFLSRITAPRAHLLGNHDVHKMSVAENEDIYGVRFSNWSQNLQGCHLVFWNPDVKLDHTEGFAADPIALEWLKADLQAAVYPVLIFSHVPLGGGSMTGNFYFDRAYPHHARYPNDSDIRRVIEESGKVVLCVNGHTHWNALNTVDGVHYVTIPSLTETFPTFPHANEAWAELQIGETIDIDVFGRTPLSYRLPVRAQNHHWANIHKPYAPQSEKPA